jgi:hypothetical protein
VVHHFLQVWRSEPSDHVPNVLSRGGQPAASPLAERSAPEVERVVEPARRIPEALVYARFKPDGEWSFGFHFFPFYHR